MSKKSVEKQIQDSCRVLAKVESPWEDRKQQFEILKKLIPQNAGNQKFADMFATQVGPCLIENLKDLRSKICRLVLEVLQTFTKNFPDCASSSIEKFVSSLVVPLFEGYTKQISLEEISIATCQSFFSTYVTDRTVLQIAQLCETTKISKIKEACFGVLSRALCQKRDSLTLSSPTKSKLAQALEQGFVEAEAPCRHCARLCFCALTLYDEDICHELVKNLDIDSKRLLSQQLDESRERMKLVYEIQIDVGKKASLIPPWRQPARPPVVEVEDVLEKEVGVAMTFDFRTHITEPRRSRKSSKSSRSRN